MIALNWSWIEKLINAASPKLKQNTSEKLI